MAKRFELERSIATYFGVDYDAAMSILKLNWGTSDYTTKEMIGYIRGGFVLEGDEQ
jgi:hypothetical protein